MRLPPKTAWPKTGRSQRWLLVSIGCLLALLLAVATFFMAGPKGSTRVPGGDFSLNSADGPQTLSRWRGQALIIYFGYTSCPDACPTALAATGQALALLKPAELALVQPLFISVDPERDHLAALKTYAAFFHPKLLGLTGSPAQIAELARRYGVYYHRQETASANGYTVDHSSSLYILDAAGKIVTILPHAVTPPQIAAALRQALPH